MADPITRIIIRRGTESERTGVALLQSEPAYSTDAKRLYMGDGTTLGGNPVGIRFLGFVPFSATLSNVSSLLAPASGDLVYDTTSSSLYALTGADYTLVSNFRNVGTNAIPDEVTIQNQSGVLSVKQNALDATYLTTAAVGTGLARSGQSLRIETPSAELGFSGNALQITNAGVTNSKLANMPPDTVKARLTTTGSPQDISLSQLAASIAPYITPATLAVVPAGAVLDYAGTTAPVGYLMCDGSAVDRTAYADLFTAIGTTYGAGDGSTTFNLPDFRGRAAIGVGQGTGLTDRYVGEYVGEESHLLTISEMPSHTHVIPRDNLTPGSIDSYGPLESGGNYANQRPFNTLPSGSSQPHNNIQPSLAVNKIIKT